MTCRDSLTVTAAVDRREMFGAHGLRPMSPGSGLIRLSFARDPMWRLI